MVKGVQHKFNRKKDKCYMYSNIYLGPCADSKCKNFHPLNNDGVIKCQRCGKQFSTYEKLLNHLVPKLNCDGGKIVESSET